jgi:hypothetical protein
MQELKEKIMEELMARADGISMSELVMLTDSTGLLVDEALEELISDGDVRKGTSGLSAYYFPA